MIIKNISNNTIYLNDIDYYIDYNKNYNQNINYDILYKSKSFLNIVKSGMIEILDYDKNDVLENYIYKIYDLYKNSNYSKNQNENINNNLPINSDLQVKIRGYFSDNSGYSKTSINFLRSLVGNVSKIEIEDIGKQSNQLINYYSNIIKSFTTNVDSNYINIDIVMPTSNMKINKDLYNILYTTVEASSIPQSFIEKFKEYDEIWVPSDFCKNIIEKYTNKEVFVLPFPIDNNLYNNEIDNYNFYPKLSKFNFISVISWTYRKGYDCLIKSFLKAFRDNSDVSLLIIVKTEYKQKVIDYIKDNKDQEKCKIFLYFDDIPENVLPKIYKSCNAYICSSRGEAFNNCVYESSLCGLPVVAVNYGGYTNILDKSNSLLVDIDSIEKIPSGTTNIYYWDNELFPSLKSDNFINSFSDSMIDMYNNYEHYKNINKILVSKIENKLNYNNIGNIAKNKLNDIFNRKAEK